MRLMCENEQFATSSEGVERIKVCKNLAIPSGKASKIDLWKAWEMTQSQSPNLVQSLDKSRLVSIHTSLGAAAVN